MPAQMVWVWAGALGAGLALVVLLLSLPVSLQVRLSHEAGAAVAVWAGLRLGPLALGRRLRPQPADWLSRSSGGAPRRLLRVLRRRGVWQRLHLRVEYGGDDAFATALSCGAAWAVAGACVGVAGRLWPLAPGALETRVVPNYRCRTWRLGADCILRLPLGHLMLALAVWGWAQLQGGLKGVRS